MRNAIMEPIPTNMVNRTSLAARKALGRTKAAGHRMMENAAGQMTSFYVSSTVWGDREL